MGQKICATAGESLPLYKAQAIAINGSMANRAGIEDFCEQYNIKIEIRQTKYLNNIVEQDHRRIKRKTRPMLDFKNFRSASATIGDIEPIHQLRKRQNPDRSLHEQFNVLAA